MTELVKRRFLILTLSPRGGEGVVSKHGIFAGFPLRKKLRQSHCHLTHPIALMCNKKLHILSLNNYWITRVHYRYEDGGTNMRMEAFIPYEYGENEKQNEKTMQKAIDVVTDVFDKILRASGESMNDKGLVDVSKAYKNVPPFASEEISSDILKKKADERAQKGTPARRGTPTEPTVLNNGSQRNRSNMFPHQNAHQHTHNRTSYDREPSWFSRRTNQHVKKNIEETLKIMKKMRKKKQKEAAASPSEKESDTPAKTGESERPTNQNTGSSGDKTLDVMTHYERLEAHLDAKKEDKNVQGMACEDCVSRNHCRRPIKQDCWNYMPRAASIN